MKKLDLTEIYSNYYKRIYRISYSITKDFYMAEDIVQETFIKAMRKLETIEDDRRVGAWLSVIATRTAIDFIRKEKRINWVPMEQEMIEFLGKEMKQNVELEVETGFMIDQINHAIRKLTFEYQNVLVLKLDQGLKEQEIANVLDLNVYTVKTRIYRARKQLKQIFLEQISA